MIQKCSFLVLAILMMSLAGKAQNKGEIRLYYGLAESGFLSPRQLEGAAGYSVEGLQEFGVRYIHHTITNLSLATGINFLHADVTATPAPSTQLEITTTPISMISIPLLVHLHLGRYFYVNGGPMLDFQLTESTHDLQSGVGFSIGLGANYAIDKFSFFLNPNVKSHALLPFEAENNHQRLTEIGLQVGVGYSF